MATSEGGNTSCDPEETKPEQEIKMEAAFAASEPEAIVTPATRTVDDADKAPDTRLCQRVIWLSK